MRVKRGVASKRRKKNVLKLTKGYSYGHKNLIKRSKEVLLKSGANAHRDRRRKKREFRKLWAVRINAAARAHGMTYSTLIGALSKEQIGVNRKMLQQLAIEHPHVFEKVVKRVTTL
jgi:large subunit ribosomal protein L20